MKRLALAMCVCGLALSPSKAQELPPLTPLDEAGKQAVKHWEYGRFEVFRWSAFVEYVAGTVRFCVKSADSDNSASLELDQIRRELAPPHMDVSLMVRGAEAGYFADTTGAVPAATAQDIAAAKGISVQQFCDAYVETIRARVAFHRSQCKMRDDKTGFDCPPG